MRTKFKALDALKQAINNLENDMELILAKETKDNNGEHQTVTLSRIKTLKGDNLYYITVEHNNMDDKFITEFCFNRKDLAMTAYSLLIKAEIYCDIMGK